MRSAAVVWELWGDWKCGSSVGFVGGIGTVKLV